MLSNAKGACILFIIARVIDFNCNIILVILLKASNNPFFIFWNNFFQQTMRIKKSQPFMIEGMRRTQFNGNCDPFFHRTNALTSCIVPVFMFHLTLTHHLPSNNKSRTIFFHKISSLCYHLLTALSHTHTAVCWKRGIKELRRHDDFFSALRGERTNRGGGRKIESFSLFSSA